VHGRRTNKEWGAIVLTVLCDQGLEGLLTGLYWVFQLKAEALCVQEHYQCNLVDSYQYFQADFQIAERMQARIDKRFGPEVLEKLYWASLSESPTLGLAFFEFFGSALKVKQFNLEAAFIDEALFEVIRLSRQVTREYHKFLGITRFTQSSQGHYYGLIKPEYNILTPLSQHFTERLSDQKWILIDTNRSRAVCYNIDSQWEGNVSLDNLPVSQDAFEAHWITYYKAISIEARKNDKLRQAFLPKRYWSHLTEMKE